MPSGGVIYRVAKPSWGALNPPKRLAGTSRKEWGRFDVPGQQTVYGGAPEEAAYAESLASLRVATDIATSNAGEVFDEADPKDSQRNLLELIADEWERSSHMAPNRLPAGWRHDRLLYELTLPDRDWFIDICHADSLAALKARFGDALVASGVEQLTTSHLTSEDRDLTTMFSEWIWDLTLDDGSRSHGIKFPSKHGSNYECYAIYLRALGDGKDLNSEPTKSDTGTEIAAPERNEPLKRVVTNFGFERLF